MLELEREERWEDARVMLYELWNADRENIDLFLRLFSECWYVLAEWGLLKTEGLSWETFRDTLIECTEYGLAHFNEDTRFLWMGGYMINLFPYEFYRGADGGDLYLEWEARGLKMLAQAVEQSPMDLTKAMYLGAIPGNEMTEDMRKASNEAWKSMQQHIRDYFSGNSAIEKYFRHEA